MIKIPFVGISKQYCNLEKEIIQQIKKIGNTGNFILGNNLNKFENLFSKYCNTKFALGLNSGSDALFLGLKALGIKNGDEIITTSHSFIATSWVIEAVGAKIVFCDVLKDGNIDPKLIETKITKKTKAIMPVHWAGKPFEVDQIKKICKRNKIFLIEDAAQAIGALYKKKKVGSFGIFAGFSLHPLKNLGVLGDGGMFVTNDKKLYQTVKLLRNHGLKNRDECSLWGYNSRLDEIQSAVGIIKLSKIDIWNDRCLEIANLYTEKLHKYVVTPNYEPYIRPVFHNYIIATTKRDSLKKFLEKRGIEVKVHYPIPVHKQKAFKDSYKKVTDLKQTDKIVKMTLSLPIYPELKNKQIHYIINSIKEYFDEKIKKSK